MKLKNVVDIYGESVVVDEDKRKVYTYNNKKRCVTYNAPIYEEGKELRFWTDYTEEGIVTDLEARIRVWNSKLLFLYCKMVEYNAPKNDPEKKILLTAISG